jgi:hypothetical protein
VHGEKNRFSLTGDLVDFASRVDTVQKRHNKVNYSHIRVKLPGQPDRIAAIGSLTDDIDAFPFEKSFQALAHHQVIVYEQDSNSHL